MCLNLWKNPDNYHNISETITLFRYAYWADNISRCWCACGGRTGSSDWFLWSIFGSHKHSLPVSQCLLPTPILTSSYCQCWSLFLTLIPSTHSVCQRFQRISNMLWYKQQPTVATYCLCVQRQVVNWWGHRPKYQSLEAWISRLAV